MSDKYRHKIAIITGGASGIGRALAEHLSALGAVVVVADLDAEGAQKVAGQIEARGRRAEAAHLDVRDAGAVEALVSGVARRHGRLDFMFNNAGIAIIGELAEMSVDDWRKLVEVNVMGVAHGVAAAYPLMIAQGHGHIVNTASVAGLAPAPRFAAYAATKHAVVGLTSTLRVEAADRGVRASAVCPGIVRTPLIQNSRILDEASLPMSREALLDKLPFDTITPEDCAAAIVRGVARNKAVIVISPHARIMAALQRFAPELSHALSVRLIRHIRALSGRS